MQPLLAFSAPRSALYAVHQLAAGRIQAVQFHRAAMLAQALHHLVERTHGGDVPEVRLRHIDAHRFAGVAAAFLR